MDPQIKNFLYHPPSYQNYCFSIIIIIPNFYFSSSEELIINFLTNFTDSFRISFIIKVRIIANLKIISFIYLERVIESRHYFSYSINNFIINYLSFNLRFSFKLIFVSYCWFTTIVLIK